MLLLLHQVPQQETMYQVKVLQLFAKGTSKLLAFDMAEKTLVWSNFWFKGRYLSLQYFLIA